MSGHVWTHGPIIKGNPTMVCRGCKRRWWPWQQKPSNACPSPHYVNRPRPAASREGSDG